MLSALSPFKSKLSIPSNPKDKLQKPPRFQCFICKKTVTKRSDACTVVIHLQIIEDWGDPKLLNPKQFVWAHQKCLRSFLPPFDYAMG